MNLDRIIRRITDTVMDAGIHYNEFVDRRTVKNYYYPSIPTDGFEPHEGLTIYNKLGEKYKVCYMADHGTPLPNRYLYFDRYDWGLKTHFYRGSHMRRPIGTPEHRYGFTGEPREVEPWEYTIFDRTPSINTMYEAIFSDDEVVLNKYDNALFVPFSCGPWYMKGNEKYDDFAYEKKNKNISIIASNKMMTEFHKLRIDTANRCRKDNLADTYGTFSGVRCDDYDSVFRDYRYSIVIENSQSDYYFTEKLTSCFAAQTIPIYLGARKISEFFNVDGIIQVTKKDLENLPNILKMCTNENYEDRRQAIIDNYNRVYEYRNGWDYLYEHYLMTNRE